MAILALGEVLGEFPRRPVGIVGGMDAVAEHGLHAGMVKQDLPRGLLDMAIPQAVHGLGIAVRNLINVRVAAAAGDTSETAITKAAGQSGQ